MDAVKVLQKEVKGIEADIKKIDKADSKKVESIDRFIYAEAQSRMKELFVTYHSMKEAAIDCRILHKFHADKAIVCHGHGHGH
jgi:flagellar motility protein MotE (MotC chaperone)